MPYSFQHLIQPDGWFTIDGTDYNEPAAYFCTQLNFCGCGSPEEALRFVRKVLRQQNMLKKLNVKFCGKSIFRDPSWNRSYNAWRKAGNKLYGSDGAMFFVLYVLDRLQFLEHGGSVMSAWLTNKGHTLLNDLECWHKENK